jgi:hypothetical protein
LRLTLEEQKDLILLYDIRRFNTAFVKFAVMQWEVDGGDMGEYVARYIDTCWRVMVSKN